MKKTPLLIVLIFLSSVGVFGQRKTITDYFLDFPPDKYATDNAGKRIKGKAALEKHRRSLIKIEDIRNGYLKLEGAWEGWAEFALFKKTDGSYLIGHAETECGPACSGSVTFYDYAKGNWTDVTSTVFKEPTEIGIMELFNSAGLDTQENGTEFYYLLPRVGTMLKMACNTCNADGGPIELKSFKWTGEVFSRIDDRKRN